MDLDKIDGIIKKYPTFCILPFTQIGASNEGNYRICCTSEEVKDGGIMQPDGTPYNIRRNSVDELWNGPFYKQLRNDMLNGVQNSACEYCWNYEEGGAFSKRLKNLYERINMYDDYQVYIDDAIEHDGVLSLLPDDLDIRVGTLCNLKCITCYPGASSLHADEGDEMERLGLQLPSLHTVYFKDRLQKFNITADDFNPKNLDVNNIVNNLDPSLSIAKHMSLVGGEPLVNKTTTKILEECVARGYAPNMMIQIITNLSVINPKLISLLESFKWPMLCISWDHTDPEKFNFIRFPVEYKVFKDNFDTVWHRPKIQKKLSTTWSIFNIFDFEDIFNEWEIICQGSDERFTVNHGFVYYPNYFSIRYLEIEQKAEIAARVHDFITRNSDYRLFTTNKELLASLVSISEYMGDTYLDHADVCGERTRVLKMYDDLRGTDYKRLFPFIKDYE